MEQRKELDEGPKVCALCGKPTARSHLISERFLKTIAEDRQVWEIGKSKLQHSKLTLGRMRPTSRAHTFRMFCGDHDQIFQPADKIDVNAFCAGNSTTSDNPTARESAFYWGYRRLAWKLFENAVLKMWIESVLVWADGEGRAEVSLEQELLWLRYWTNLVQYREHCFEWIRLADTQNWDDVHYRSYKLKGVPSVAACGELFLGCHVPFDLRFAVLSVIPSTDKNYTIFLYSSLAKDSELLDTYLNDLGLPVEVNNLKNSAETRQLLTKHLLRDIKCITVSPRYWDSLPKKNQLALFDYLDRVIVQKNLQVAQTILGTPNIQARYPEQVDLFLPVNELPEN